MTRTRTLVPAMAVLMAVSLSGCVATPTATVPPSPLPTPPPSTTTTPAPTFSAAQRPAAALVEDFSYVLNRVASDPDVPLDDLHRVAAGDLVDHRLLVYSQYRRQGIVQVGTITVTLREVRGDSAPYVVEACVDAGASDMVDPSGNSVMAPESPALVLHRCTIERFGDATWQASTGEQGVFTWRVGSSTTTTMGEAQVINTLP